MQLLVEKKAKLRLAKSSHNDVKDQAVANQDPMSVKKGNTDQSKLNHSNTTQRAHKPTTPHEKMMSSFTEMRKLSIKNATIKAECISPTMNCEKALNLFRRNPQLECAVVIDDFQRPVGLVMKNILYRKLSQRFSADLFSEKPIVKLVDKEPLIVDILEEPQRVIEIALNREGDRKYDCVIVTEGQIVAGVLTMSSLLALSNQLQTELKEEQKFIIGSSQERIKNIASKVQDVEVQATTSGAKSEEMVNLTLEGKTALQQLTSTLENTHKNALLQQAQMNELQVSANEIIKIISLVHDLAEQSNLLAINATIEAARAGEHGKAFGVVAQEVMKLAAQTKKSAQRISQSITSIADVVKENVETSNRGLQIGQESDKLISSTEDIFLSLFKMVAQNKSDLREISEEAMLAKKQANKTVAELNKLHEMNM